MVESPDAGTITDDDATVNQFTFDGSLALFLFLAFGGVALAWMYVVASIVVVFGIPTVVDGTRILV